MQDDQITITEASVLMGMSESTLKGWVYKGLPAIVEKWVLPFPKPVIKNKIYLWSRKELVEWKELHKDVHRAPHPFKPKYTLAKLWKNGKLQK